MTNARTKVPAHDKWVCLPCRWTAKLPSVDVRVKDRPSYRCPTCEAPMLWTGTAFRPPRKEDDEEWRVLDKLFATGFRFFTTSTRRRVPRTEKDLAEWIAENERPERWLVEHRARVKRDGATVTVHCGRQPLAEGERVLVWDDEQWREGQVRLSYAGRTLQAPVVVLTKPRRSVALQTGSRVRLSTKRTA